MKPSARIILTLASELKRELGADYDVLVQPRRESIGGVPITGRPDFVVFDRVRGNTTIVEVNGSILRDDLPVAAAFEVLHKREQNKALHPRMVLVSSSRLDRMLRGVLACEGVATIETEQPREAVSRVTSLIRAAA
jgi:hypothetical protein